MKGLFEGIVIGPYQVDILFDGNPIPKYFSEINHSPDGFQWGYGGSGPAQAAYAILRTAMQFSLMNEQERIFLAKYLYQQFKWDIVAKFSKDRPWILALQDINEWIWKNKGNAEEEWEKLKEVYKGDK